MNKFDPKEAIANLSQGFGIMAETSFLGYKAFLNAGFSEDNALYLTGKILDGLLHASGLGGAKNDG